MSGAMFKEAREATHKEITVHKKKGKKDEKVGAGP